MKSKGFTLVELLAVLVLISLIALIAIPSIINYINQSQGEIDSATEKLIFSGAQLYVDQNKNDFKVPQKQYCVTLQEIVDQKYLSDSIFESVGGKKINLNTFVKVGYYYDFNKERYEHKYDISSECTEQEYICVPVTEDMVIDGNVPSGNYNAGDEYICQVLPDRFHRFFVLKKQDDNNIKLIMNENLGTAVKWAENGDNSEGPVIANAALVDRTRDWTKLIRLGGTVELPKAHDIAVASGYTDWNHSSISVLSWMVTNPDKNSQIFGYWTSTPVSGNLNNAWNVSFAGGMYAGGVNSSGVLSIRPVIIINSSQIKK